MKTHENFRSARAADSERLAARGTRFIVLTKIIKLFVYCCILVLSFESAFAANTRTSNGTGGGTWATGGTWVGGVAPLSTDNAIIAAGDTVTLGGATTIVDVTINSTGIV